MARVLTCPDRAPDPGQRTTSGYDLGLVTTDQTAAATLVARYAARWAIEQASGGARNVLGAGEARNRVRLAASAPSRSRCSRTP